MTDNPWYSFYVGDYARKTAHLSLLEHGAYRLLLDYVYSTKLSLPNDMAKLFRICRATTPSERRAVQSVVSEYFSLGDTGLENKRCRAELDKLLKYSNRQSAAAKLRHSHGTATAKPRTRVPQPQPHSSVSKDTSPTPAPLPDWLPIDLWNGYLEMRRQKGAKPTERAKSLILSKLDKWRSKGHDPSLILEKAITSNWTDIWEPKENYNENTSRNTSSNNGHANQSKPIGKSGWTTAAEQLIAEDEATGRWKGRI